MNLSQLRYISEIAKRDLNISAVASFLNTNQPGISKQLKLLEAELGVEIFLRSRNRLSGITPHGQRIIEITNEVLKGIANLKAVGEDAKKISSGSLTIGVTHTQAKYVLPEIMKRFSAEHPRVRITMRQAASDQIIKMLASGEVDVGITATEPPKLRELVVLPFREFQRIIIVPRGHKLLTVSRPGLHDLAKYPIVTYEAGYGARQDLIKAFASEGLEPKITISAIDADVIKTCVEQGMGITVLSEVTFDARRDNNLRAISAKHLFKPFSTKILLSRQHYLRRHTCDFIEMCAPRLSRATIQRISGK